MTDPGLLPSAPGAAFTALTVAVLTLLLPRPFRAWWAQHLWALPCAAALAAAFAGGVIDARAGVVLIAFGGACVAAARATRRATAWAAHAVMLGLCAGLFLHLVARFENPALVTDVVLGPGSPPYSKALNFDKGMAGLLLLGLYLPRHSAGLGARDLVTASWRFVLAIVVVLALALALGYVRWDPKLPSWSPLWMWSMIFLTALPEEALFRGVVQGGIARAGEGSARRRTIAVLAAAVLFGAAHLSGGAAYVLLATIAGIGYGCVYDATRSVAAAALAHAGLNTLHFLLFSYPSLVPS